MEGGVTFLFSKPLRGFRFSVSTALGLVGPGVLVPEGRDITNVKS